MTATMPLELSAEDKNSGRDTAVQTNIDPRTFDPLLPNTCDSSRVLGVLRAEVADRESPDSDIDTLSECLIELGLDGSGLGTIEHLSPNVLTSDRRAEDSYQGFTCPLIGGHRLHPGALHHSITADFANTPDDADCPAYGESDYCHDYNNDQKSKHVSTLLLPVRAE